MCEYQREMVLYKKQAEAPNPNPKTTTTLSHKPFRPQILKLLVPLACNTCRKSAHNIIAPRPETLFSPSWHDQTCGRWTPLVRRWRHSCCRSVSALRASHPDWMVGWVWLHPFPKSAVYLRGLSSWKLICWYRLPVSGSTMRLSLSLSLSGLNWQALLGWFFEGKEIPHKEQDYIFLGALTCQAILGKLGKCIFPPPHVPRKPRSPRCLTLKMMAFQFNKNRKSPQSKNDLRHARPP